jgi:hypothetical protein
MKSARAYLSHAPCSCSCGARRLMACLVVGMLARDSTAAAYDDAAVRTHFTFL